MSLASCEQDPQEQWRSGPAHRAEQWLELLLVAVALPCGEGQAAEEVDYVRLRLPALGANPELRHPWKQIRAPSPSCLAISGRGLWSDTYILGKRKTFAPSATPTSCLGPFPLPVIQEGEVP